MTSTKAEFVKRHEKLKWLEPAFEHLEHVINDYVDTEEEPPFWNNERSNVSLLLAAAACAGRYIALSEYPTYKTKKRKGKKGNGRCDLYICEKSDEYQYLEMEAKSHYVGPEKESGELEGELNIACHDAKTLYEQVEWRQAGLLFEVMSVPDNESFKIEKFREKFKAVDSDFCWFWYDSDLNKEKENEKGTKIYKWNNEARLHPGVGVFLKFVR